jgi:hypothetical protein
MTRLRELEDEIKTLRNWNAQLLRQIDQLETDQQLKRLEVVEFKAGDDDAHI